MYDMSVWSLGAKQTGAQIGLRKKVSMADLLSTQSL